MNVQEIYLKIIYQGVLNARTLSWKGNAEKSDIELDHIHNLPRLLMDDSSDGHVYYWETERASYLKNAEPGFGNTFSSEWIELDKLLTQMGLKRS